MLLDICMVFCLRSLRAPMWMVAILALDIAIRVLCFGFKIGKEDA